MIATHRGARGGNVIKNTWCAFEFAMAAGSDIVEMDVVPSADGKLYVFHDGSGNEERLLGIRENIMTLDSAVIEALPYHNSLNKVVSMHVNSFEEVLERLRGREVILNIDRAYDHMECVLKVLEKYDMWQQILVKSPVRADRLEVLANYPVPVMYMPIVWTEADIELVRKYPSLNVVAMEICFTGEDSDIIRPEILDRLHADGLLLWGNAMKISDDWNVSAWHDDMVSVLEDPSRGWGWLADHKFDIIQTDWPGHVSSYLRSRGLHE